MLLSAATEWTKTKCVAKLFPNLYFRSSSKASHPSQESRNSSLLKRFLLQLLKVNDNGGNCPQPTASGLWQLHPEVLVIMRESDTDFLPIFLITAEGCTEVIYYSIQWEVPNAISYSITIVSHCPSSFHSAPSLHSRCQWLHFLLTASKLRPSPAQHTQLH